MPCQPLPKCLIASPVQFIIPYLRPLRIKLTLYYVKGKRNGRRPEDNSSAGGEAGGGAGSSPEKKNNHQTL